MENNKYDICGFNKEEALNDFHKNDLKLYNTTMKDLYEIVFIDMIENYIEDYNLYKGNSEDKLFLSESEKKRIAHNLIYDDDPLWEHIEDCIKYEIDNI